MLPTKNGLRYLTKYFQKYKQKLKNIYFWFNKIQQNIK